MTDSTVVGLRTEELYVTRKDISKGMERNRELASLSSARTIQESGRYWISPKGIPTEAGYYKDNHDGTFTKIADRNEAERPDRIYISPEAAAKAVRGDEPLALSIWMDNMLYDSRMNVDISVDRIGYLARITSVMKKA